MDFATQQILVYLKSRRYVLAIAVGEFCDTASSAWFRVGFLRFYHPGTFAQDGERFDVTPVYVSSLRCLGVAIALCWVSAFALVPSDPFAFGLATSIYVIANGTVQISLSTLRGEGRARTFAAVEALRPLANLALGLLALKLFHPSFAVAAFSVFGSNALIGVAALAMLWIGRARSGGRNWLPEIVAYAWPLVLSAVIAAAMNTADRYQLQWWLGSRAVALYVAAYSIGRQPIDILFNALNLGAFTELMKTYDMKGQEAASRLLGRQIALMLALALPAAVGLSLLAPDILHIFFDRRYWEGTAQIIPVACLMALFAGIKNYGYDQGFHMTRQMRKQVYSMAPSVVIGVGLTALLISRFGLAGAAYGTCVGFGCSLLLSVVLVRQSLPGRLPWHDVGKIVVCVLAMAAVVELSRYYGPHNKVALAATILAGMVVYGTALLASNALGIRSRLFGSLAARRT